MLKQYPTLHEIVSCTSRPKRENEIEGINYYYHTKESFENKVKNNEMLEYTYFNGWYYGTGLESVDEHKINIGVFNPRGIQKLSARREEIDLKVFLIDASDKTRLLRQLNRENNPNVKEIIRRFNTDEEDFSWLLTEFFVTVPNDVEDTPQDCAQRILNYCDEWMREGTID